MEDSQTGSQIAFLTPWEIRQRNVTDQQRPVIQQMIVDGLKIRMEKLERFEGELWADVMMEQMRDRQENNNG